MIKVIRDVQKRYWSVKEGEMISFWRQSEGFLEGSGRGKNNKDLDQWNLEQENSAWGQHEQRY